MHTKISVASYAKKLRAKRDELKAQHSKDLAAHQKAFDAWKRDLKRWVVSNVDARVKQITMPEVSRSQGRHWGEEKGAGFQTGAFFVGAPKPPQYPVDKRIREIDNLLRQLAITGQKTLTISTVDVAKYLGDGESDEG